MARCGRCTALGDSWAPAVGLLSSCWPTALLSKPGLGQRSPSILRQVQACPSPLLGSTAGLGLGDSAVPYPLGAGQVAKECASGPSLSVLRCLHAPAHGCRTPSHRQPPGKRPLDHAAPQLGLLLMKPPWGTCRDLSWGPSPQPQAQAEPGQHCCWEGSWTGRGGPL